LILDTDLLIALLKGQKDANKALQGLEKKSEHLSTTVITAYELLKGAQLSSKPEENTAEVQKLLTNLDILDLTLQACEEASTIYCDLKKAGCLTGEFDVLIAAIARICDETIMTRDNHFKSFKNTKIAEW